MPWLEAAMMATRWRRLVSMAGDYSNAVLFGCEGHWERVLLAR
jgi:hypothetical protein